MKQQDALRCSSSRRESSPAPENLHAKRIGCLSGIFRLLSKSHNRRRSITFGQKQEKNSNVGTEHCAKRVSSPAKTREETKANKNDSRRFSCDDAVLPRSPTLPAGIRRGLHSPSPPENLQTPQSMVVTRLMGLEDHAAAVAEKRRRLLGALEKCDDDLKALKKMIEVVKSKSITTAGDQKGGDRTPAGEKGQSEPCPAVSVLDEFARSALSGFSKRCSNIGRASQQQQKKIKPGEEESIAIFDRITTEIIQEKTQKVASTTTTSLWTSKAMIESVNEVCRDISWGERREVGRIGLALQDCICRDLIDEIVKEMGSVDLVYSLPFESCKRRLIF